MLIRTDLIEYAFANSQIVRTEAGAIEAPTQHLREPVRARRPCFAAGFLLRNYRGHGMLSDNIALGLL